MEKPVIKGEIIAAGVRSGYNVGRTIKFSRFAGTKIEHLNEQFIVLTPNDILSIL